MKIVSLIIIIIIMLKKILHGVKEICIKMKIITTIK